MKCNEKHQYLTKKIAKQKKKIAESKYGYKLTIYKCNECEKYHFHSGSVKRIAHFRIMKKK